MESCTCRIPPPQTGQTPHRAKPHTVTPHTWPTPPRTQLTPPRPTLHWHVADGRGRSAFTRTKRTCLGFEDIAKTSHRRRPPIFLPLALPQEYDNVCWANFACDSTGKKIIFLAFSNYQRIIDPTKAACFQPSCLVDFKINVLHFKIKLLQQ